MFTQNITLENGVVVPQLALGTWLIDDDKAAEAVRNAIALGYRHIDTAQAYANERGVGEGVRTAGIPREEIFVTSKVAAECKTYESAAASIEKTLEEMGLDYIDMMIIHSPVAHGEALKNETIAEMAKKYGVTTPQLCIRYDLQLGMITLPKTANKDHMQANADVDFEISAEDMEILKQVKKIENYGDASFFPVFGGKM